MHLRETESGPSVYGLMATVLAPPTSAAAAGVGLSVTVLYDPVAGTYQPKPMTVSPFCSGQSYLE